MSFSKQKRAMAEETVLLWVHEFSRSVKGMSDQGSQYRNQENCLLLVVNKYHIQIAVLTFYWLTSVLPSDPMGRFLFMNYGLCTSTTLGETRKFT
jgi:hypothetical protein